MNAYTPTELCLLAKKYGSDKCPQIGHMYTPFYYELLKDRRLTIKKVLEIGVGNHRQIKLIPGYVTGASLRMWRDFFPNAQVYGADISPHSFFEDERIQVIHCDETKKEDIQNLLNIVGTDIDLVVDDALHHINDQIFLFENLMPKLNKGVTYIVEDCRRTKLMHKMFPQYEAILPELLPNPNPLHHDGVIVLTK